MPTLIRDVQFGLRLLRRSPGFTIVALFALALGIGANTAIFSVVYGTLLAPMPYPEPDQLVMVWSRVQGEKNVSAAGDFLDWREQATVFQDLNAWTGGPVNLAGAERPQMIDAVRVTPGFYSMLGLGIVAGRHFIAEEGRPGTDQVVLLRYRAWDERFDKDPSIVGKQIRIDGKPRTVVGVLAPLPSEYREPASIVLPLSFTPDQINHDFHWLLVMGRLKPGVTLAQANANMSAVTTRIAAAHPKSNTGWTATVEPLQHNFLPRETQSALWLLLGAVGFVLLIACVNVANLTLARGSARQREIAVRVSIGASRGRIFRQLLSESLTLAIIGGALGIGLSSLILQAIVAIMPQDTLPYEADLTLNVQVLVFTVVVSTLSGVLFGCAPAWQAARGNVNEVLKDGGRSSGGVGRQLVRRGLVIAEFALALSLLAGGGLAMHSLVKLWNVDLGFRTDRLAAFQLPVQVPPPGGVDQINAIHDRLIDRIGSVPGIMSVSASTGMPVRGVSFGMPFTIVGKPVDDPSKRPGAGFNMVSPSYYWTFGIQIIRGRTFTNQDRFGTQPVAIVNETFAKRYFPDVDPLTQRIAVEQLIPDVTKLGPPIEWQIVGVHRDVRNAGPRNQGFPEIEVPLAQSPWPSVTVAVRTAANLPNLERSLAQAIRTVDPDLPIVGLRTMDQIVHESIATDRFRTALFGSFGAIGLLLAAFGIYGVMSFVVAQRTHEIGLRMALGAERGGVIAQVLKEGMLSAAIGVALGFVGAYFVGRAMQGMWFGVGAIDPVAFGGVALVLLTSALVACVVPARRAASVDPLTALRQE
ncbi:MAG TPA: ABC transporter permease [Vicinamibacterales bacterium]|jgi:putative ABC transport system permease protein